MEIDVVGSFNTLKATLPYLLESAEQNKNDGKNPNTGGRIIFVSATLHYAGTPFQTHVAAAKAAIDALSANAAIEFGPRGITSNIIAPGPIGGTEGMERLVGAEGMEASKASVPLGRYGLVKEIADATVYLFSDAGNYVNGDLLVVDGGSWRMPMNGLGGDMSYPRNVLTGEVPKGVKSGRKTKL
jgi:peroxisomal 2,4-dienoyl-CoA reductase